MTTLIHTVSIQENPHLRNGTVSARRESKTRQYLACLVATVTQKVVDDRLQAIETIKTKQAKDQALLEELTARLGLTVEEAKVQHDKAADVWMEAFHTAREKLWAEEQGKPHRPGFNQRLDAIVKAQGYQDPYKTDVYAIVNAAFRLRNYPASIKALSRPIAVGDQMVLSWHSTAAQASKALNTVSKHYSDRGYEITIRTDIEIVSKD